MLLTARVVIHLATTTKTLSLDEIVAGIQDLVAKNAGAGSDLRSSYLHLLSPGLVRQIKHLTVQISYRQVGQLLDRLGSGDELATTVLLVKYFPIVLRPLRGMNANTRVQRTGTRVKRRGTFTFDDFKHLGIEESDLVQQAASILLQLLHGYKRRTGVFLGLYLRTFFPARFATYVRNTMTYREGGKRKAKIRTLAHGGLPEDLPMLQPVGGSEEVRNFSDFMEKAPYTKAHLMRYLGHYLGGAMRAGARIDDLVFAILQRGWTLVPVVWRQKAPPPAPTMPEPINGRIPLYIMRDAFLDEFLRTRDAHRHLHALQRGTLGGVQIAIFEATYGAERTTDQNLADLIGKNRPTVRKARARAVDRVLERAVQDYQQEVRQSRSLT